MNIPEIPDKYMLNIIAFPTVEHYSSSLQLGFLLYKDILDYVARYKFVGQGKRYYIPSDPPKECVEILNEVIYDEDRNLGNAMQREYGTDLVFPKSEIETAAGQYTRLVRFLSQPSTKP